MKKLGFYIFCILNVNNIFSQDFNNIHIWGRELISEWDSVNRKFINRTAKEIEITNNIMTLINLQYSNQKETYTIQWERDHRNVYIVFNYNGKNLGNNISHGRKRYLILFDSWSTSPVYYNTAFVTLYDENNALVFSAYYDIGNFTEFPIRASSELIEHNIVYRAENLINFSNLIPWVEGQNGNGVGEYIIRTFDNEDFLWNFKLILSNGFIDYNRPHLYEYNNRIKEIRIYYEGARDNYIMVNVADVPNFQTFYLNLHHNYNGVNNIIIEIVDIYPGSRYNDTCINFMELLYGK
ncbi:MAG: hypothetical protein LBU83_09935 [Bacteroidales bacterium]|jgi:hypothetical protein|nr:hypothetical protein [Bacteroidales bacterium]